MLVALTTHIITVSIKYNENTLLASQTKKHRKSEL